MDNSALNPSGSQSGLRSFAERAAVTVFPAEGHRWISPDKFELNPDIPVPRETPTTFLLQAENDLIDSINDSLVYYIALITRLTALDIGV